MIGRQMDVEDSRRQIQEKLRAGDHTIALEMIYHRPAGHR